MQIILDKHFNHLEHFIDEVQYWDLDLRLLGTGGFKGFVKQLTSKKILITYTQFMRTLDQVGATPPGYRTFVLLGNRCNGFRWRGHQITQDDLLIFPNSNQLHAATHSDFEVFTISIHLDYLNQLIDDFGLKKILNKNEVVHLDKYVAFELRRLATTIIQSSGGESAQILANTLAQKVVIVATETSSKKITNLRKRDIAVDKVVEFVRNTPVPTSELAKLCRIANVSERTLQYAFKQRYGITPNAFVKRWVINTVRRQLLLAHQEEISVTEICMNHNIVHLGQFSADYKKLFTELPSETLKNRA